MKRSTQILYAAPTLIFVSSLVLYAYTAGRYNLGYADTDELVTTAYLLGIPHHPGYPVFTWLLHIFLKLPISGVIAHKANLFSALIQSLNLSLLYILIKDFIGKNKYQYTLVPFILAIGTTSGWWFYASVIEVFPLNHTFILLYLIYTFKYLRNPTPQNFYISAAIFGLGLAHHPTFRLMSAVLIYVVWKRQNPYSTVLRGFSILGTTFLLSYTLLVPLNRNQAALSWPFTPSISGIWETFTYQIYTDEGSAVETYTKEFNVAHSVQSLTPYLKFSTSDIGFPIWLLSMIGIYTAIRSRKNTYLLLATVWFLLGPLMTMYMKFPQAKEISDSGYFFGTLLRTRMLLASQLFLLILSYIGAYKLVDIVHSKQPNLKTNHIFIALGLILITSNLYLNNPGIKENQVIRNFAINILESLPQDAVFFVDDDLIFTFLYHQQVENLRPDLVIIPTTWQIRFPFALNNWPEYFGYQYPDHTTQIAQSIAWNLSQGRRVFTYALEPNTQQYLGLNSQPFYAIPSGYTLEITTDPAQIPSQTYQFSQEALNEQFPVNEWDKAWKGNLSVLHTYNGYYSGQLQNIPLSEENFNLANQLAQLPHNQQIINKSQQALLDVEIPEPTTEQEWIAQSQDLLRSNQLIPAAYAAQRAMLINPKNGQAHLILARISGQLGNPVYASMYQAISNRLPANTDDTATEQLPGLE